MDVLIQKEKNKPIIKKQLFFLKNPHKIEIVRILKQLLTLFEQQKSFLEKAIRYPKTHIGKYFYEFEEYIREEAQLLDASKKMAFIFEEDLKKSLFMKKN